MIKLFVNIELCAVCVDHVLHTSVDVCVVAVACLEPGVKELSDVVPFPFTTHSECLKVKTSMFLLTGARLGS